MPKFNFKNLLSKKVFIIAEAGVNHNGDIKLAYKLVDVAKEAQADAVKFQTFITEESISKTSELAPYQKKNLASTETQFEMAKKLELTQEEFLTLKKYCNKKNILFLSTPDEEISLRFLIRLGMPVIKIGSGEITNIPLLRSAARTKKPIILSTGISNLKEIESAIQAFKAEKNQDIYLLHCVTEYPAPVNQMNLRAMQTMEKKFQVPVGLSDHTLGIEISIAAVAMGARIIEKHFTLSKQMAGPDHQASLSPEELKELVKAIRNVELAMGDGIKKAAPCEIKNLEVIRKSLVSRRDMIKGEVFSAKDIAIKKPGYGIPPSELNRIIGRTIKEDIKEDEVITWGKIK